MVSNKKIVIKTAAFLAAAPSVFAQTAQPDFPPSYYNILAVSFLAVIILIIAAFLYFGMGEGKVKPKSEKESAWTKIKNYLTAATPIEREDDIMLDHDYDGIKELDNKIPPWFTYLFYATILFGVYYMIDYHILKASDLQIAEYEREMEAAALERAELERTGVFLNEENVQILSDPEALGRGREIFKTNCVACHAEDGGGSVGPNLTDKYWIHGGSIVDIFKTIKYGVPEKGMVSWQQNLNPMQMQDVANFVLSLQGTTPANPKQPEGEIYIPKDSAAIISSSL